MLKIDNIASGYGKKQVIFDLSLEVIKSEVVGIIGSNGSGKSTILKAICGILPVWSGDISFITISIKPLNPSKRAELGISFCPQGGRVFDELTVRENLELGGYNLVKKLINERVEKCFETFPVLREKFKTIAGKLSGGEQQILSIARALISKPKLLLLDEPSLGLSPMVVDEVYDKLKELNEAGVTLLIAEQNLKKVLSICNRVLGLKLGKVILDEKPEMFQNNSSLIQKIFL